MIADNAIYHIVMLACFSDIVRANRSHCDNDLAREAHDNVALTLDELQRGLREHLDYEFSVGRETDPAMQEDLACRLRQREEELDRYWFEPQPFAVGGWNRIDGDGQFRNPVTGCGERLGEEILVQPIPEEMLCGLHAILPRIAAECRVSFDAEIIFYRTQRRPMALAKKPEPFDPDAPIPW